MKTKFLSLMLLVSVASVNAGAAQSAASATAAATPSLLEKAQSALTTAGNDIVSIPGSLATWVNNHRTASVLIAAAAVAYLKRDAIKRTFAGLQSRCLASSSSNKSA